jgi:hypothetical protein
VFAVDEVVYKKVGIEESKNGMIALKVVRDGLRSDLIFDGYASPVSNLQLM